MYVVTSRIFNVVVLGIFVSFYCFIVLILFMCQSRLQELNKTYLLIYLLTCQFKTHHKGDSHSSKTAISLLQDSW